MSDYNQHSNDAGNTHFDGLAASAQKLAAQAEELLHSTASMSGESIAALRKTMNESLSIVRKQVGNAQDYAVARGKQAAAATDTYVHDRPWQAIGLAALLGVAIGFIGRGSRS